MNGTRDVGSAFLVTTTRRGGRADPDWPGGHPLFPRLDIWDWGPGPDRGPGAYGPNGPAVEAVFDVAVDLSWLDVERVGSVWSRGNRAGPAGLVAAAIERAAVATGRRDAVTVAFLDGQHAVLAACAPVAGALEHWWNNYPEVPAMEAAGYLAAATAVADALEPAALAAARAPFNALRDGLPTGVFGPRHGEVVAILEAVSGLNRDQADRIVASWAAPEPRGDLEDFGYPGPAHPERGLDGWMPMKKGRHHLAWIELMTAADRGVRDARNFDWARVSTWMRTRVDGQPPRSPLLKGAIEGALAATLLADLVPQMLADGLTAAWRVGRLG